MGKCRGGGALRDALSYREYAVQGGGIRLTPMEPCGAWVLLEAGHLDPGPA